MLQAFHCVLKTSSGTGLWGKFPEGPGLFWYKKNQNTIFSCFEAINAYKITVFSRRLI